MKRGLSGAVCGDPCGTVSCTIATGEVLTGLAGQAFPFVPTGGNYAQGSEPTGLAGPVNTE